MNTAPQVKFVLLALCVLVNCSGLFVTIIGPDGALYATIAKTMVQRNNYVELFAEGRDWLDKPHFPFWITALSFKFFGFTTWAYKLPAILFLFAGAAWTYAFAKKLYNREIAFWSVIVLLTAEHIILSNNDVRAEPYLTALVIGAVYHFYLSHQQKHWGHLIIASLLAACAVMTKGLFALVPIGGAIAGELLIKRKWREIFHIRWFVALILILLFISPELYCLYYQFDAHPEKTVFGKTDVSGIRFFFWDSQFGRFFNTGPIKGKGDLFFFVHTLLWAFLPWCILLYAAIYKKIRNSGMQEWYTLSGALLCFILFSASQFQLPHYINIVFPFFAIITVQYVARLRKLKTINIIQTSLALLILLLMAGVQYFFRPGKTILFVILFLLTLAVVFYFSASQFKTILLKSALVMVGVNLYLNLVFYPALLKYQSGSEAAFFINKNYPGMRVVQLRNQYSYALDFYLHTPLISIDSLPGRNKITAQALLYVPKSAGAIERSALIRSFEHFHISRLTPRLLNQASRVQELEYFYLYK